MYVCACTRAKWHPFNTWLAPLLPRCLLCLCLQTSKVAPFTVGCPACLHNFIQLWCFLSCSSDQATFTNVTEVQQAVDNNATAVKEVDIWMSRAFSDALYDSCKASVGCVVV